MVLLEVWEWISNFIPHIIMDVITYPWGCPNTGYPSETYLISLAPGRCASNFKSLNSKQTIRSWTLLAKLFSDDRLSRNIFDDKSTSIQVMTWCHQATSHYLNPCWPRPMASYGITRPQWDKIIKSILARSGSSITFVSVAQLFWYCHALYKNQNQWPTEKFIMDKWDFRRYEFNMRFLFLLLQPPPKGTDILAILILPNYMFQI